MKAGHLYLPDNDDDLIYNKSGVYTLYEHFQNVNNVNNKNTPITTIYDDFKTLNTNKYSYIISHNNITVFNNSSNIINCYVCGVQRIDDPYNYNSYINFIIKPLVDSNLSFLLYNPNYSDNEQLEYILENCYSFYVNDIEIDLLSIYDSNPDSYKNDFSLIKYYLNKDTKYDIKIQFNSNLYYCIRRQDLAVTNIFFPEQL